MRIPSFLRRNGAFACVLAGAVLLAAAGCASTRVGLREDMTGKQYFHPTNFHGETRLSADLRRVILLPVYGGSIVPPETAATLEEVFATELQKEMRFEVVRLSRTDCQMRFGAAEFSSTSVLPHDFLATLGREYAADAVLFVDLTAYQPYRPLTLGVRSKLATIEQTRLVWTFDEIFSADDPAVGNSVRHYYGSTDSAGIPHETGQGALQSPSKFAAYVAAATFNTLPPR